MRQAETEQLRQERETFEFNMRQAGAWLWLRLSIGYVAMVVIVAVFVLCTYVIIAHDRFGQGADKWAMAVLGVDIISLVGTVIKLVFNSRQTMPLTPVTHATLPPPPPC